MTRPHSLLPGDYESTGSGIDLASAGRSEAESGREQVAANSTGVTYPSELCGRWWL